MFLLKNSNLLIPWRDSMNHFLPYTLISQLHICLLPSARECSHLLFGIKISLQKTRISNIETDGRIIKKRRKTNKNDFNIFYTFLFLLTFAWRFSPFFFQPGEEIICFLLLLITFIYRVILSQKYLSILSNYLILSIIQLLK